MFYRMKKAVFFFFMFFLLASTSWAGYFVSVSTSDAWIYENTSTKSEIAIGAPQHYPLYVLAKAGKWRKVKDWMGTVGWIRASDICDTHTLIVRKYRVNFRSGPSRRYRKIDTLFKGSILKVIKKKGYWFKVQVVDPPNKKIGWIYRTLVWGY